MRDVIEGNELKIGHREAQAHVQQYFQKREEELNKEREAKGKEEEARHVIEPPRDLNKQYRGVVRILSKSHVTSGRILRLFYRTLTKDVTTVL